MGFGPLLAGEGGVGKGDEVRALLGEDLGDGALAVFGTGALGGTGSAPVLGLVVEVVDSLRIAGRGSSRARSG